MTSTNTNAPVTTFNTFQRKILKRKNTSEDNTSNKVIKSTHLWLSNKKAYTDMEEWKLHAGNIEHDPNQSNEYNEFNCASREYIKTVLESEKRWVRHQKIIDSFSTMTHITHLIVEDCFGGLSNIIRHISKLENLQSLELIDYNLDYNDLFSGKGSIFKHPSQIQWLSLHCICLTPNFIHQLKQCTNLKYLRLSNVEISNGLTTGTLSAELGSLKLAELKIEGKLSLNYNSILVSNLQVLILDQPLTHAELIQISSIVPNLRHLKRLHINCTNLFMDNINNRYMKEVDSGVSMHYISLSLRAGNTAGESGPIRSAESCRNTDFVSITGGDEYPIVRCEPIMNQVFDKSKTNANIDKTVVENLAKCTQLTELWLIKPIFTIHARDVFDKIMAKINVQMIGQVTL